MMKMNMTSMMINMGTNMLMMKKIYVMVEVARMMNHDDGEHENDEEDGHHDDNDVDNGEDEVDGVYDKGRKIKM